MRTECVHINHVTAPLFVEPGQPLLLVCDYDYQPEEESQLDLKWYFNDSPIPVFQWVPSMGKQPQVVSPLFRGMVDTGYKANNNSFKKHQALHIPHPDHRLSGSYMCKVSSFLDEDFQQSQVTVITYPKEVKLSYLPSRENKDLVKVECVVDGAFPEPNINISLKNK